MQTQPSLLDQSKLQMKQLQLQTRNKGGMFPLASGGGQPLNALGSVGRRQ